MGTTHFSGPVVSAAGFITGTDAVSPAVTASTVTIDDTYNGEIIPLNRAAGIAVTLPAATGSQAVYTFFIPTTITSNSTTIKVANATDVMNGIMSVSNATASTVFATLTASDTVTLNGSTTGGVAGTYVAVKDIAAGFWTVSGAALGSGTVATPFSATVS